MEKGILLHKRSLRTWKGDFGLSKESNGIERGMLDCRTGLRNYKADSGLLRGSVGLERWFWIVKGAAVVKKEAFVCKGDL